MGGRIGVEWVAESAWNTQRDWRIYAVSGNSAAYFQAHWPNGQNAVVGETGCGRGLRAVRDGPEWWPAPEA
jgi:hypothetical protein